MIRLGSLIERVKDIIDVGNLHDDYRSLVHCSVSWNTKCIIRLMNQLADRGEYLNTQDDYGNTPLLYALQLDCPNDAIIRYIDKGADVNCSNFSGCTPLLHALNFDREVEIIFKLLDSGAVVDVKDESGMTPLMCAIMRNGQREVIIRLLYATSDINCIDKFGRTGLIYALLIKEGDKDLIYRIIGCGADPTFVDEEGNSILHKVIGSTWMFINTFISNHGISIDDQNINGETPLFLAAKYCDCDKVQTLLSLDCDPNIADKNKRTPLHVANETDIINLIIYYGGDLKAKDSCDFTPLDLQLKNRKWENAECIIKHCLLLSEGIEIHNSLDAGEGFEGLPFNKSLKQCVKELDTIRLRNITENLSFHKFCSLKRTKNSKFVNISKSEYLYKHEEIVDNFPNFFDIILLRMKENEIEKKKYDLIQSFSRLSIQTYSSLDCEYGEQLNYDCIESICQYLTHKELFNLFLASL